jgi:pimeloyl-ACP methyl ester carboxylesterase
MQIAPPGATIPGVTHHRVSLNGTDLHYVAAGAEGTPILLVHGFPETWWAFHKVIPLLAKNHRVHAVDLRGFGDSGNHEGAYGSEVSAIDVHALIEHLGVGPMHVVAQDISGGTAFRLAGGYPEDVLSLTAIEMGLAGFGLESFADVTRGGSWHIGVLAAQGVPEMVLQGRESEFIKWMFQSMTAVPGEVTEADIAEFARSYRRPGGWRGAAGLYRAMLGEGAELRDIANKRRLTTPVLAIGAGGGAFTATTMAAAVGPQVRSVQLDGVGHYAAMDAPEKVAAAILDFVGGIEAEAQASGRAADVHPTPSAKPGTARMSSAKAVFFRHE